MKTTKNCWYWEISCALDCVELIAFCLTTWRWARRFDQRNYEESWGSCRCTRSANDEIAGRVHKIVSYRFIFLFPNSCQNVYFCHFVLLPVELCLEFPVIVLQVTLYVEHILVWCCSLPKSVKRRIKALKRLQSDTNKVESKFYEEVHELEQKYAAQYEKFFHRVSWTVLNVIRLVPVSGGDYGVYACSVHLFD